MPKKQKRRVSQKVISGETQLQSGKTTADRSVAAIRQSGGEFNPDYTYVQSDLKRIGTLAGFFILVLIVLSFFLR